MSRFITLDEPRRAIVEAPRFALWQLGFRPFYLLASVFAALSVGLWSAQFAGWIRHPYLSGSVWHAHEMLFGFTLAVVVGFLFTAGRNWSNRPTPSGPLLAAFVALWLAGRILVLTPLSIAAAVVNVAFPLAAAIALAIPFWKARNRRNYFFVGLLVLIGAAELVVHLSQLGVLQLPAFVGVQIALDVVLFIMAVMGGRVIPMFTNNGIPGAGATRQTAIEKAALGSTLVLVLADVAQLPGAPLAGIAVVCATCHLVRWLLWRPWRTASAPLVWVLHAAYAWIPLHLALRCASAMGWIGSSAATHALTAGAIGGLTIGMMTRTARGHTGRPLHADRSDVTCYALVLAGALVRVLVPLLVPGWTGQAVVISAAMWSGGFALFALRYGPMLCRPRLDGKPG